MMEKAIGFQARITWTRCQNWVNEFNASGVAQSYFKTWDTLYDNLMRLMKKAVQTPMLMNAILKGESQILVFRMI